MLERDTKVIGYFAYRSRLEVVCTDVDACVIAGSEQGMKEYLVEEVGQSSEEATIRKTRFAEIAQGLSVGAAYAFDRESYERFFPLARQAGLPVAEADFDDAESKGNRFFTVRLVLE
jgi:hypothetical protein